MKAIINHLNFEFKSVIRDKTLLLMNYLFPLVFYFMMASIMPSIYLDFSKVMVPGMIVFTIMISTLMGMPNPMVLNKEMGVYHTRCNYDATYNHCVYDYIRNCSSPFQCSFATEYS